MCCATFSILAIGGKNRPYTKEEQNFTAAVTKVSKEIFAHGSLTYIRSVGNQVILKPIFNHNAHIITLENVLILIVSVEQVISMYVL